jgi:predicted ester cyclase
MATATLTGLRAAREAVVQRHVEAEARHDVEATLATFHAARYEVPALGVSEGADAVRDLLQSMITGFPDWRFEPGPLRHGDDFVLVELRMFGTHLGPWAGWEPTGRKMDVQVACVFEFTGDQLVCERVYFDFATVMRQLGKL